MDELLTSFQLDALNGSGVQHTSPCYPAAVKGSSAEAEYVGSEYSLTPTSSVPDSIHSSHFSMTWYQQSAWIAVFSLMLIVAIVGNSIVIWIVLAHRRMRTVINYFLLNLSLSDLMMSIFNCIFNFIFMLHNNWPFGAVYCSLNNFIANATVAASVFTLTAISIDRYLAIVRPLRPRMSKCSARIILLIVWISSISLALPFAVYSETIEYRYPGGEIRTVCVMVWPDGLPTVSQQDYAYNIALLGLTYLIPMLVMAACYSRMSCVLWGSKGIGELSQRHSETMQSKRKVVRMFIVIISLFATCWLPYHIYFVCQYHNVEFLSSRYVQHIYLFFYWLAMSNAMINPLVYYWMNARFRQYFNSVICGLCGAGYLLTHEDNAVPPRLTSRHGVEVAIREDLRWHSSPYRYRSSMRPQSVQRCERNTTCSQKVKNSMPSRSQDPNLATRARIIRQQNCVNTSIRSSNYSSNEQQNCPLPRNTRSSKIMLTSV